MTAHRYVHPTKEPLGVPCLAIPTESMPDLTPYGWAPGGYMIGCAECDSEFGPDKLRHMGDKRAFRCVTHALAEMAKAAERAAELRTKQVTAERYRAMSVTLEFIRDSIHGSADYLRGAASTTLASLQDHP